MDEREAKDFLVQQAAEQAAIEGVPLSDLEKRMMYFTESGYVPEDPIKLNQEFETQYDSDEYETKVSNLLDHAYARLKKDNSEAAARWNEAIRELEKGDHYFLVFWSEPGDGNRERRPPYDSLKLLGTALLIVVGFLALLFVADHYGIRWEGPSRGAPHGTQRPMPLWMSRLLFGLMVGSYVLYLLFPWIRKRYLVRSKAPMRTPR